MTKKMKNALARAKRKATENGHTMGPAFCADWLFDDIGSLCMDCKYALIVRNDIRKHMRPKIGGPAYHDKCESK